MAPPSSAHGAFSCFDRVGIGKLSRLLVVNSNLFRCRGITIKNWHDAIAIALVATNVINAGHAAGVGFLQRDAKEGKDPHGYLNWRSNLRSSATS